MRYPKARGEGISDEFKSLFFRMLIKDSSKRPSIDDVLNDIWFENVRKAVKDSVIRPPKIHKILGVVE